MFTFLSVSMPDSQSSFRIGPKAWRDAVSWFGTAVVSLIALCFAAIAIAMVNDALDPNNFSPDAPFLIFAGLCLLLAGTLAYVAFSTVRSILGGSGTVRIEDGFAVIELKAFFPEPVVVPLDKLRFATVSNTAPRWEAGSGMGVFPVYNEFNWSKPTASREQEVQFYLFDNRPQMQPLFYPTKHDEWPNLALLFELPVHVKIDARFGLWPRRVVREFEVPGICLRAKDVAAAARALDAIGRLRNAVESDARHIEALIANIYSEPHGQAEAREFEPSSPSPAPEPAQPVVTIQPPATSSHSIAQHEDGWIARRWNGFSTSARIRWLVLGYFATTYGVVALFVSAAVITAVNRDSVHGWPVFFTVMAAVMARAAYPRLPKRSPDGVRIDLAAHPALARVIAETASQMGVEPPTNVYVSLHSNAYATRLDDDSATIGLGLFIMSTSSVEELRAVIAHEIAHRSDVRLTPWMSAMWTSFARLEQSIGEGNAIWNYARAPVRWYCNHADKAFTRIRHDREFAADAAAAKVVGSDVAARDLEKGLESEAVIGTFWHDYFVPAIRSGFRPPLAKGLAEYSAKSERSAEIRSSIDSNDPEYREYFEYESSDHPSTQRRIEAVRSTRSPARSAPDRRIAATLLGDVRGLEDCLLRRWLGDEYFSKLRVVDWSTALDGLLQLGIERRRQAYGASLKGLRWGELPQLLNDPEQLADRLGIPAADLSLAPWEVGDPEAEPYPRQSHAAGVVHYAICDELRRVGWQPRPNAPGMTTVFTRGGKSVSPYKIVEALWERKIDAQNWLATLSALGISAESEPSLALSAAGDEPLAVSSRLAS